MSGTTKEQKKTRVKASHADPATSSHEPQTVEMLRQLQSQVAALQKSHDAGAARELESLRKENAKLRAENTTLRETLSSVEKELSAAQRAKAGPSHSPPRHRPYYTHDAWSNSASPEDCAGSDSRTNRTTPADADLSAYPVAEAVVAEVLDVHSDSDRRGLVGNRLASIHSTLNRLAKTGAYATTLLVCSLRRQMMLSYPEDLYTLWRAFGGEADMVVCRSRLIALSTILENYPGEALVIRPRSVPQVTPFNLVVPEEEIVAFTSAVCSRLPKLKSLSLVGFTLWPLSSKYFSRRSSPFCVLAKMEVLNTPWSQRLLIQSVREHQTLTLKTFAVSGNLGPVDCDTSQLFQACGDVLQLK